MTTFLLVRHARHEMGGGTLAGRTPEVHLSDEGRSQAAALAERLASVEVDALYTSPMTRCQETAAALGEPHGLRPIIDEGITELDFGDWTGAEIDDLAPQEPWHRFNAFRSGTRAPGGELFLEVQSRIVRSMLDVRCRHEEGIVVLVSHADTIRAALLHFLGMPMDHFLRLEISPASVSVLTLDDWGPRVLGINHTGALPVID